MTTSETAAPEVAKWDPILTERVMGIIRPVLKRYFRSEVHGLDNVPAGGALVVSNHSGGQMAVDVPVFAIDWYAEHGYDRPIYTLSHDMIMVGPIGSFLRRIGFIPANHDNAASALRSDGIVVVFPGGDYDAYRPTLTRNVIDFGGRTGYVRAAIEAGVPIVPTSRSAGRRPSCSSPAVAGWRGAGPHRSVGARKDRAGYRGLPVRVEPFRVAAERPAARQDRDPGPRADQHSQEVR